MAKQETPSFNTKQLMAGFAVGHMSIYNWRNGTPTKDPLPHLVAENGRVSFPQKSTIAWAKKHDLEFDPAKAEKGAKTKKPGPKPAAKKAAPKAAAKKATKPAKKSAVDKMARAVNAEIKKAKTRKIDPATTEAIRKAAAGALKTPAKPAPAAVATA